MSTNHLITTQVSQVFLAPMIIRNSEPGGHPGLYSGWGAFCSLWVIFQLGLQNVQLLQVVWFGHEFRSTEMALFICQSKPLVPPGGPTCTSCEWQYLLITRTWLSSSKVSLKQLRLLWVERINTTRHIGSCSCRKWVMEWWLEGRCEEGSTHLLVHSSPSTFRMTMLVDHAVICQVPAIHPDQSLHDIGRKRRDRIDQQRGRRVHRVGKAKRREGEHKQHLGRAAD